MDDPVSSPLQISPRPRRILFVASECVPFAKSGGLGDVVAGLAKALTRKGHDVRIVIPRYYTVDKAKFGLKFSAPACVHMGQGEEQWIGVMDGKLDGQVPVWFVDCERYFGRGGLYHEGFGEYSDNAYRFALLSKAALQICKDRDFIPQVIHLHDWQAALTAGFLKTWDRIASPLSATASVLTIHNIGYQGVYHAGAFPYFGIGGEYFSPNYFEDHGRINLLKSGVAFADALTTVSPTHAQEIVDPIGGMGLALYLNDRSADLFGILNGVDYEHWDPSSDRLIPAKFSADDLSGKAICKEELQKRFGLERRPDIPLIGIVSRFAAQKGFDLLKEALPRVLDAMSVQLVALGTGDQMTEDFFQWMAGNYPGRVGIHIGFSEELSHRIEAGSDFFLMPSLYEPCGLNQIYSLKYGTLPIVRATGGLEDSVINYNQETGEGTGFKFLLPTSQAVYDTVGWAVSTWYDRPEHMAKLRQQAMQQDFSWDRSASAYVDVYEYALKKRLALLQREDPAGYEYWIRPRHKVVRLSLPKRVKPKKKAARKKEAAQLAPRAEIKKTKKAAKIKEEEQTKKTKTREKE